MPHVSPAEAAREVPVFPGMVNVIVRVIRTGIVTYPLAVRMDVRSLGMSRRVAIRAMFSRSSCRSFMNGSRAVRGRFPSTDVPAIAMLATTGFGLRKNRNRKQQTHRKKAKDVFHAYLRAVIYHGFFNLEYRQVPMSPVDRSHVRRAIAVAGDTDGQDGGIERSLVHTGNRRGDRRASAKALIAPRCPSGL